LEALVMLITTAAGLFGMVGKAGFGSRPMLLPELVMLIRHYQWN
jgi:hypothetical protein